MPGRGGAIVWIPVILRKHVHVMEYNTIHAQLLRQPKCGIHNSAFVEQIGAVLKEIVIVLWKKKTKPVLPQ